MSKDSFTLFAAAPISRDEYNGWLHQLNAVMIPEEEGPYDARLSKDVCHIWISLLEGKWFNIALGELEEEAERLCQFLSCPPKSAIVLTANDAKGSQILAVQFAALCAEQYPCLVYQHAGKVIYSAQELLEL